MAFPLAEIVQIIKGLQAFYPHLAEVNRACQKSFVSTLYDINRKQFDSEAQESAYVGYMSPDLMSETERYVW